MLRFFLPAFALFAWSLAAALGVDPDLLRVFGPAVTGLATAYHIRKEVERHRDRT